VARIEVRPYLESDETAVVGLWKEVFSDVTGRNDPKKDIQRKLAVQRELFLVATCGTELRARISFPEVDPTNIYAIIPQ